MITRKDIKTLERMLGHIEKAMALYDTLSGDAQSFQADEHVWETFGERFGILKESLKWAVKRSKDEHAEGLIV